MSKIMRIVVMFDLPTQSKKDKDNYIKFRRYLLQAGYVMLQYSIYTKICNGHSSVKIYCDEVKRHLPECGQVRVLTITNNQFQNMHHMIGEPTKQEQLINEQQITFL